MSILDWGPFARVRRNHAVEHATLQVLAESNASMRMAGYSDPNGFWLLGEMETPRIEAAVQQALARMRSGERSLAIHPHCGTNLVTTGFLAGGLAWLAMLGMGRSTRDRVERLPLVISLVTLAILAAQPLGPQMQALVTTSADVDQMEVVRIERRQRGNVPLHRVITRFSA